MTGNKGGTVTTPQDAPLVAADETAMRFDAGEETEIRRCIDEALAMAGHRGNWPHDGSDCFAMNCRAVGPELEHLRASLIADARESGRLRAVIEKHLAHVSPARDFDMDHEGLRAALEPEVPR